MCVLCWGKERDDGVFAESLLRVLAVVLFDGGVVFVESSSCRVAWWWRKLRW